jgi:hypothetical protein
MNKIAAFREALLRNELEKRASVLVERYGTCDGQLPAPYAQAFMEMEKEALLANIGKAVTGGIYGAGKAIAGAGGAGAAGARTGLGGRMMDWASSVGGKGANEGAQKLIGGAALGAGTLGLAGGGYLLGRPSN